MADLTPAKLRAEILAGAFDGSLIEIVDAIRERFDRSESRKMWRIRFDGDEWTEETITLGEVAMAERALGLTWLQIDPAAAGSHLQALIAAHIAERDGAKYGDALNVAKAMPMGDLLDVLSHYEKAEAPKG